MNKFDNSKITHANFERGFIKNCSQEQKVTEGLFLLKLLSTRIKPFSQYQYFLYMF